MIFRAHPSQSSLNFHYYITFVDAYLHKVYLIYLLKTKSEALNIFKQFKVMAELQFGEFQQFKAITL